MKGNSVQHRRKLELHFAFRFVSVDARITVSKIPSFSDINYRRFFFIILFCFHVAKSAEKREFFWVVRRELFT